MKVLIVSPLPPLVGGMSTFTVNLTSYINSNPEEFELFFCNTSHFGRTKVSLNPITRILMGVYNAIWILFKVVKILKRDEPHLIHLSSSASFTLLKDKMVLTLAKFYKVPVIVHWHFGRIPSLAKQKNWEWKQINSIIKKAKYSIVLDKESNEVLHSEGHSNIVNIPNPISTEVIHRANELHENIMSKEFGRVIFVGHVIRSKGVYELVEACTQLEVVNELVLIGPYEESIKNDLMLRAKKRNNGSWLSFTGELSRREVLDQMSLSPFLVLPSYTEGFPLVIIEAMAMACAIVATNVGAIPQILNIDSASPFGLCVPIKDSQILSNAIQQLTQNRSMTINMGLNGQKASIYQYSMNRIGEVFKDLWRKGAQTH